MINLFLIKNKLKNKTNIQNNNNEIIEKYKRIAQSGNEEVIKEFYTNIEKGLTEKEAEQRLEKGGFRLPCFLRYRLPGKCFHWHPV